jgi:alkanesulfonate monooxygenase SsuD/methylene tetrahydromethanopterin reductase-like flavin-dependent oxidoreductase (luciferase family)
LKHLLELPCAGPWSDPASLADLARRAEAAGWNAVLLEDYVFDGRADKGFDPWICLAAMALSTSRVCLGTLLTPLSRRRPWQVARQAVTLDHLSAGRMILGAGLGDLGDQGFAAVGEVTDAAVRAERLDEALTIVDAFWRGEPVTFAGRHFNVAGLRLLPRPVQRPRIPIWVGGSWPRRGPLRRAAAWDGFSVYRATPDGTWQDLTADEIRIIRQEIEAVRREHGAGPFELIVGGANLKPGRTQQQTAQRQEAEAAGATWWCDYIAAGRSGRDAQELVEAGPLH